VIGAGKEFEPITARVKAGMAVMADFVSMVHWEDPMPPGVKIPAARGEFLWLVNGISRYVMNSYLDFIEGKRPHTLIASLYPVMDGLLERSLSSGKLTVAEFHIITRWRLSGLPFRASALHLMIYIKRNENFERMITKDPGVVKQSTGLFPLLSFAILCLVKQGGVWYDDSFVLTLLKLGANPNEPYQGWTAWTTLVGTMYWLRGGSGRKYEVIQDIIRLLLEHGAETSRQCLFVGEIEHCGPRKIGALSMTMPHCGFDSTQAWRKKVAFSRKRATSKVSLRRSFWSQQAPWRIIAVVKTFVILNSKN
jgi:hypothetical protein